MLIRALIVFLAILNLGVAVWWMLSPGVVAPTVASASEASSLQLVAEAPIEVTEEVEPVATGEVPVPDAVDNPPAPKPPLVAAAPAPSLPAAAAEIAATVEPAPRCYALGPFADIDAARAAAATLGSALQRSKLREQAPAASAYTVFLPPASDRAVAQAAAQRITAAGFTDLLVISSGEQANSVALGRYSNRERAEQRQAALRAAGFPAQLQAVGAVSQPSWWADVSVIGASKPKGRVIDCAAVR